MNKTTKKDIIKFIKYTLKNQKIANFTEVAETMNCTNLTRSFYMKDFVEEHTWNFYKRFFVSKDAKLIIDDTTIEKEYFEPSNKKGRIVRWIFDHSKRRSVVGIQIVFMILLCGEIRIPLGFHIYDGTKTKLELALELLSYARNRLKLRHMMVVFDSWYPSKKILKRIQSYGWYFDCRIKRNRKISGKKPSDIVRSPKGSAIGFICGIKVILVRNNKHYLISNKLSLSRAEIISIYKLRWKIETFFKDFKFFDLELCQSRLVVVWKNVIFLSSLCFFFVELKRCRLGVTFHKARRKSKLKDYSYWIKLWEKNLQ